MASTNPILKQIVGRVIGIYKITSPSGRIYIGQSWHIKSRWRLHIYPNNKNCGNSILSKSFKKYGIENHIFKVIHALPLDVSQNVLDEYERMYIELYKNCGSKMSNLRDGGKNAKQTAEAISKMRERMMGNTFGFKKGEKVWNSGTVGVCKAWNKGKKIGSTMSEKAKQKLSEFHTGNKWALGRKLSQDHKDKILASNKGRKMPDHVKEALANGRLKNHSQIIGYRNKGKVRSQENKNRISETLKNRTDNKGELSPKAKLTNLEVLEIRAKYKPKEYTTTDISRDYNISKTNAKDIIARRIWKHI